MGRLILVLGGARSGKSAFAQRRAGELGGERVLFVATAGAGDEEMRQRIEKHQPDITRDDVGRRRRKRLAEQLEEEPFALLGDRVDLARGAGALLLQPRGDGAGLLQSLQQGIGCGLLHLGHARQVVFDEFVELVAVLALDAQHTEQQQCSLVHRFPSLA